MEDRTNFFVSSCSIDLAIGIITLLIKLLYSSLLNAPTPTIKAGTPKAAATTFLSSVIRILYS